MATTSTKSPRLTQRWTLINIFVLLATITWIARFWHCADFGLYEDDYTFVGQAMGLSGSKLWDLILKTNLDFRQGRPIGFSLSFLFSFLGAKLGGLHVVYWIGYVFVTVNSFLFYVLLKRMFAQQGFALIGALAFCLFPADTTQAFLTHSLSVQPSLMFLLIASHCYLSGRTKLSYLVIFGSLICYETLFPVFLAAPLLKNKWDSRWKREFFRHALVLGAMVVCVVIIRKIAGEDRVSSFSILSAILFVGNPIIGPIVSMAMFLYRPIETLLALNRELLVFLPLCFAFFAWVLSRLKLDTSSDAFRLTSEVESRVFPVLKIPEFFKNFAKPALIGLIMLVLAYPLTLTVPAVAISGRASRVHLAAVVGASILFASLCSAILSVASAHRQKRLATLGIAGLFAFLVGFGLIVQQDYKLSWQYQRGFWTDVVRLCPDITDGTVIFVEPTGLLDSKQIKANEWSLPLVLEQIYKFPDDWKKPPAVYRLQTGWQEKILLNGNIFQVKAAKPWVIDPERTVESSNAILLEIKSGQLTRRTEPIIINGSKFTLKPTVASGLPSFEKGHLFDYLIRHSDEEPINYLIRHSDKE